MSIRCVLALSFVTFAACGGSDDPSNPDAPTDARPPVDARPSTVMEVNCAGATIAKTYTTGASSFLVDPTGTTINRGETVRFVSTSTHPVGPIPGNPNSDSGLVVPETQTKCFTFPVAGPFSFRCTVHGYVGTLTVN